MSGPKSGSEERGLFALELLDDRYPALHGLRVLGIVCVVQFHVSMLFAAAGIPEGTWATTMSYRVFFGMDLFFVLSGFLIGSILFRSLETRKTLDAGRFYLRRILRTFPPYWIVLTVLAVSFPLNAAQRAGLPFEYAFLTNLRSIDGSRIVMGWGWSLALEEQFYLVAPLLVGALALVRAPARIVVLATLMAVALVVRVVIWRTHAFSDDELRNALYFPPYARFDTLIAGVLLALVHRTYGASLTAALARPRVRGAFVVAILTCLWLLLDPLLFGERALQAMHVVSWGTVTSVMYVLVVVLLLHGPASTLSRALSAPFFRRAATLGYGVYLVHVPLGEKVVCPLAQRMVGADVPSGVVWTLALVMLLALSLAVAYVLHLAVEKPMLRLRDRITA